MSTIYLRENTRAAIVSLASISLIDDLRLLTVLIAVSKCSRIFAGTLARACVGVSQCGLRMSTPNKPTDAIACSGATVHSRRPGTASSARPHDDVAGLHPVNEVVLDSLDPCFEHGLAAK